MPKTDRLAGLTEEEYKKYHGLMGYASVRPSMDASIVTEFAESLAACRVSEARKRALLEKHEWAADHAGDPVCPECRNTGEYKTCEDCNGKGCNKCLGAGSYTVVHKNQHASYCALAAELEGTEGG